MEQVSIHVGHSESINANMPHEDTVPHDDDFSWSFPLFFSALVWISISGMFPHRTLLSLLSLVPALVLLPIFFWKKSVLQVSRLLIWFSLGVFFEIITLALQLVALFILNVSFYSFVSSKYWDGTIHGLSNSLLNLPEQWRFLNVALAIIVSLFVFGTMGEACKYLLTRSIPSTYEPTFLREFIDSVALAGLGMATMESIVLIMVSGDLTFAIMQIALVVPIHVLSACSIGFAVGTNRHGFAFCFLIPCLSTASFHLTGFLIKIYVSSRPYSALLQCMSLLSVIVFFLALLQFLSKDIDWTFFSNPSNEIRFLVSSLGRRPRLPLSNTDIEMISYKTSSAAAA